jgi:hypothetical protein
MKFQSNAIFNGTITANSVANAGVNTDKFLVLDASGNVDFRTAAELYSDLNIANLPAGYTSTVKHAVKAGVALIKGQAVYVTSADGTNMVVSKASNDAEATSSKTMGLIESTLSLNGIGNVITEGLLAGLDTTGATSAGDPVWLGTNGNLIYGLANKPSAPAHMVFIGIVTRINANNGEIFVKVQNGFELEELHNVDLKTTTPINGHILGYNGTLWVNKTISGWLGFTPANDASVVHIAGMETITGAKTFSNNIRIDNGSGSAFLGFKQYASGSTGISGFTSIYAISTDSLGISFGAANDILFKTASPTFPRTYTFPDASGTVALTSDLSSYVPTSRTLTINGTTYDLSANRSWTIDSTSASTRTIQKFTADGSSATYTITGGYAVGMVDVFINGIKLDNATEFTASNGTTVVIASTPASGDIVEVYKYGSQFIATNALRQKTLFTATAGQTTFTVTYSVGLVDVFYNGSKLDDTEYTATNGTSIVFNTACVLNDKVEVIAYTYNATGFTGVGGSGTAGYLSKWTASGTLGNSIFFDDGTNAGFGTATIANYFSRTLTIDGASSQGIMFRASGTDRGFLYQDGSFIQLGSNAGGVIFKSNDTERMRITSTGNVGIGTSSPNSASVDRALTISGTSNSILEINYGSTRGAYLYTNSINTVLSSVQSVPLLFNTGDTERMRITSGGQVSVGTSSASATALFYLKAPASSTVWSFGPNNYNATNIFRVENSDTTGVYLTSGNTSWTANSDERLKNITGNIENAIDSLLTLRTVKYTWKKDTSEKVNLGLIAQDVQKVFPEVIDTNADEMLGVRYQELVPVLVKAIQELKAENDNLKSILTRNNIN